MFKPHLINAALGYIGKKNIPRWVYSCVFKKRGYRPVVELHFCKTQLKHHFEAAFFVNATLKLVFCSNSFGALLLLLFF